MKPNQYYVLTQAGGTAAGPLSKAEVEERITSGTFQGNDLVWVFGTREPRRELRRAPEFTTTFKALALVQRQSELAADRLKRNSRWMLGSILGAAVLGSVVLGKAMSGEDEWVRVLCLWLVLPLVAGLLARTFANDPEDGGLFFCGGSIVGIIAAVILPFVIGNLPAPGNLQDLTASEQDPSQTVSNLHPRSETSYISSAGSWHSGGTLHRARVRQWKNATVANKLATCADWISAWQRLGLTRNATYSPDELRLDANELRSCLDQALEPIGDHEEVAGYASLSAYLLQILRKE